jgi:hypothetical protein
MHCVDIDGDGDIDVATHGYWLENTGGDLEHEWPVRIVNDKWFTQDEDHWRINATKVACSDLDKDGKAEIIISHSEKPDYPIAWYDSKDPRSDTWEEFIIGEGLSGVHTLQAGDLDNDGDIDILAGENGDHFIETENQTREVRIYLNAGNNLKWEVKVLKNDGLYNGLIKDINLDGKPDILGPTGHGGDPFYLWINHIEY